MRHLLACLLLTATLASAADGVATARTFAGDEGLWAYELVWLDGAPDVAAIIVKEHGNDIRDQIAVKDVDGKPTLLIGGDAVTAGTALYREPGLKRTYDAKASQRISAAIAAYLKDGDKDALDKIARRLVVKIRG